MKRTEDVGMFDVVAEAMIRGFRFTDGMSAEHEAEFGLPMTLMSRIQTVRSVTIAQLSADDSGVLQLSDEFVDFGKVQVEDLASGWHYLLRARSRRPTYAPIEDPLFEADDWVHHVMLYGFENDQLVLSTGPISVLKKRNEAPRLVLRDALVEQGRWNVSPMAPDDGPPTPESFDQGAADVFDDLDDIDLDLDADEQ